MGAQVDEHRHPIVRVSRRCRSGWGRVLHERTTGSSYLARRFVGSILTTAGVASADSAIGDVARLAVESGSL